MREGERGMTITYLALMIALVSILYANVQQRKLNRMSTILYAAVEDIQEVRTVTHGEPKVDLTFK